MSASHALDTAGGIVLELLQLTASTVDMFPPVKSAAVGVLHIAELVVKFRLNQKNWKEFSVYVQVVTARIIQSLARTEASQTDLKDKLDRLNRSIHQTVARIQSEQDRSRLSRFSRFLSDPEMITEMRKEIDDAVGLFELEAIALTEINVQKTLDALILNSKELSEIAVKVASVSRKASLIGQNAALDKLRYVHGASWDSYRVCLPNTRVNVIDDALSWVYKSSDQNEAQILLLTAVAGAGKSTIAHTFAQRCAEKGLLVSSFFFDREVAGRNSPAGLFSTIAAGLSKVNKQLAMRISNAIENDQDLPRAPVSRQFEELVMSPALECTLRGPLVIVIDALDEGWSRDLLTILQDHLPRLPGAFRIFITSRMRPELEALRQQRHVTPMKLDVTSRSNMEDMSLFIPHKLKELARIRGLGDGWPDEHLRKQFEMKAEGLFLWATTVCEYLQREPYPTQMLEKLVSGPKPGQATRSAETQMDKLYAAILHSCDWDNENFVTEYHRIVGAAVAIKTPLTINALNALFHEEQVISSYVLQQLSPLLTGTSEENFNNRPLRVIHQSFRDFLVHRAASSAEYSKFQVMEKQHSQRFALLCLETMNRDLNESIVGGGYLANKLTGIPSNYGQQIPEALWYACQFWINHLLDARSSDSVAIRSALQRFIDSKAILWIQLMAARSQFQGLKEVRRWCNEHMSTEDRIDWGRTAAEYAPIFDSISIRLGFENRREEALASAEEAVELHRQLAPYSLTALSLSFTKSLRSLSICLSDLGRRDEALDVIREPVELLRQLAVDQPIVFNPELARTLTTLSYCFSDLDRREEALVVIQESIGLYRQLADAESIAFNSDLARSLNTLSFHLSGLDRREEALAVIQESVELYQQLAADQPAVFSSDFARSLHNLSNRLSDSGRDEEALAAIQKAVPLRRQLAADHPSAFIPDLAKSLHHLSNCLLSLGRCDEALIAIQESVPLRRQLAANRPIAFNPDLAASLNNLSICLSSLGRHEEALASIQESVLLFRNLATDLPAAFNFDLAQSLNNLSHRFSGLGRREEALKATQESLEIYRYLAKDRPNIFIPQISKSIKRLSECLTDLGRVEEASIAIEEVNTIEINPVVTILKIWFADNHTCHGLTFYSLCFH